MKALSIAVALLVVAGAAHADSINSPNAFGITPSNAGDALALKRLHICVDQARPPDDRIEACQSLLHRHLAADSDLWIGIGLAYDEKRDAANAIDAYTQAYMAGGKITALERRALTYAWSGRYDLALTDSGELFDLTAKRGSMVAALANRCFLRAVAGKDLDAALADCDAVLAADRDNPDHAVSRGFALLKAARWTDALAQLNAVLVKHPKNADALYLRAACKAATSDAGDATTDRAAAVALDPKIADYYDRYGVKAF